jgi:hypothetical protein
MLHPLRTNDYATEALWSQLNVINITFDARTSHLMAIYLRGGRFNKDAMLALIHRNNTGFPSSRMIAHAEAALDGWSSSNEWVEYEMLLNDVLPNYDDPVIRIHDINLLNANLAVDILRTHTVAIIGGPGEELVLLPAATLFARNARAHRRAECGGYSQSAATRPLRARCGGQC